MQVDHRSYSSKIFRPKPVLYTSDDQTTLIVAQSWGDSAFATRVVEEISKYLESAKSDVEATTPFEIFQGASKEANYLRVALQITNEVILRAENNEQYNAAVEVLALQMHGTALSYARIGQPQLFVKQASGYVQPISSSVDLRLPPLPQNLLGIYRNVHIDFGTTSLREGDSLLLLSSSLLVPQLFSFTEEMSIASVTDVMAQAYPENPFWIAKVTP